MTVNEVLITKDKVSLIEGKHSKKAILPSKGDIKDGLFKMILYCNLTEVKVNGVKIKSESVLCLTSSKLKGGITSSSTKSELSTFFKVNKFSESQIHLIETVIAEAKQNKFIIKVQYSK